MAELLKELNALLHGLGVVTSYVRLTDEKGELRHGGGEEPRKPMTAQEMILTVDAALVLLSNVYVHLPSKRVLHATDPQQALRSLRTELEDLMKLEAAAAAEGGAKVTIFDEERIGEREFHDRMTTIFSSLRDRHTQYLLPRPFSHTITFLPFMVEVARDDPAAPARYVVTKIAGTAYDNTEFRLDPDPKATPIEITHWNGVPIAIAVGRMAEHTAGGNLPARHQRAVDRLTLRWLGYSVGPDEEWVDVGFTVGGERFTRRFRWLAVQTSEELLAQLRPPDPRQHRYGSDEEGEWIGRVRKALYVKPQGDGPDAAQAQVDRPFTFRRYPDAGADYGYLRIYTFSDRAPNKDEPLDEYRLRFRDAIRRLLVDNDDIAGLVIDVRANPGGFVTIAESLLALFSPRAVEFQGLQYINTPDATALARKEIVARKDQDNASQEDVEWARVALDEARATGAPYVGTPRDTPQRFAAPAQAYQGPVVVIVDAMTFSSAEIFAAGMQDNGLATIVGTTKQSGGGGACVKSLEEIQQGMPGSDDDTGFKPAYIPSPKGDASCAIAVYRTLRVGPRAGVVLEDMGVVARREHVCPLTTDDVCGSNQALLSFAARTLRTMPNRRIHAERDGPRGFALSVVDTDTTAPIDRIDALAGGLPVVTAVGAFPQTVQWPAGGELPANVLFRAYAGDGQRVTSYPWTRSER
jgi:C-terminal processing protease CtpA/Prc